MGGSEGAFNDPVVLQKSKFVSSAAGLSLNIQIFKHSAVYQGRLTKCMLQVHWGGGGGGGRECGTLRFQ